jgi:phosphatidylglycerol---prolipoprotein diacylglyceryl transferase
MSRELLHIYGPFSINSYGTLLLIGILTGLWFMVRDPRRKKLLSAEELINCFLLSILVGIVGGRLLSIITEYDSFTSFLDFFAVWNGGLSLLGTVISLVIFLPLYLKKINAPILPVLDLAGTYAFIIESISRLGCFFAGCCFGRPTDVPWAIIYTNPDTIAPLDVFLHPTQLYSAGLCLLAFLFMYFIVQKIVKKSGLTFAIYLMLEGAIRFTVDFFRDDQEFFDAAPEWLPDFSIHQWLALGLCACGIVASICLNKRKRHGHI